MLVHTAHHHTDRLNQSQLHAVHAALSRSITLWQGPPGTGKTRTLTAMVAAAVAMLQTAPAHRACVLAVAASNVAVDNLVEGLLGHGLDVVRMGQPVRVAASLRDVTLDARVQRHPLGVQAAAARARMTGATGAARAAAWQQATALEEQAAGAGCCGLWVVERTTESTP